MEFEQKRYEDDFVHKRELFLQYLALVHKSRYDDGSKLNLVEIFSRLLPYIPSEKSRFFYRYETLISMKTSEAKIIFEMDEILETEILPCIRAELLPTRKWYKR